MSQGSARTARQRAAGARGPAAAPTQGAATHPAVGRSFTHVEDSSEIISNAASRFVHVRIADERLSAAQRVSRGAATSPRQRWHYSG